MISGSTAVKWVCTSLIAMTMLVGCAVPFGNAPYDWVQERYSKVSGEDPDDGPVTFASDKPVPEVVGAIAGGTNPDETRTGSGTSSAQTSATGAPPDEIHYLRYDDDWLVTVYPNMSQTYIEVQEFEDGYRRHRTHLIGYSAFGSAFRGGGDGFGK